MTHHKTLEQDPALTLHLLDTLLEVAPVGFVFLDRDLRFVRINDQLAEINGYSVEEHLGKTVREIVPSLEATLREVTQRILATGQPVLDHEFTGQTLRAPGIIRHWNQSWYPVRDGRGEIIGFGAVVAEITARMQGEAALREAERNYRALADASSEISYRMSADWSTMLPLAGGELVASSDRSLANWAWLDQYLPRDEHDRVMQAISIAIAGKCLFEMEHRVLRPDGSTGWVSTRAVPILDEKKDLIEWFGTIGDITERKRIELELIEATEVAQKASQAKSEFLSTMSHELRTPLHSILGYAQLMESGASEPTPSQRQYLNRIVKGGWYLLGLIDELLDLAHIESGKLALTEGPVSLAEVMLDCHAMIEPLACERGITVTLPSFELPGYVSADRSRVKQVVINLLSNAIKYNSKQGAITVEYALSPPGAIRISVRDTGEGLAPEELAQLFQPFNRLRQEAGPEQGKGIGLVMSKRLIELMGGTMGVDSVVGVGSVFWIELKWTSTSQTAGDFPARR